MAKVIEFDRKHFRDGIIRLSRGDYWNLTAQITEYFGSYSQPLDLAEKDIVGVSGFFQPDTNKTELDAIPSIVNTDDCSGPFSVVMPAASGELVRKSENGVDIYFKIEDASGRIETVYTENQPIAVIDRGFQLF